jgi:hypothetical protein
MLDPHREIQALVDNFVAELSELAKRIAIDQIKVAFDVGANLLPGASAKLSARVGTRPSARTGPKLAAAAPVHTGRARRGQHEIEALRDRLLAAIAEQPGRRTEDLNAALGTRTTQIAQPLRRLVVDKLVRTEGARRGTRYFAVAPSDSQNGRRSTASASASAAAAVAAASSSASETASVAEEPSA